jgi:hypothetical protein
MPRTDRIQEDDDPAAEDDDADDEEGSEEVSPEFIIGFIALVAILLLGFHFATRFVLDYVVTERGIYLRFFRALEVRLVGAGAITGCDVVNASDLVIPREIPILFAWRLGNRFASRCVVVRTRRWFMRAIIATPQQPEQFCAQVGAAIARNVARAGDRRESTSR